MYTPTNLQELESHFTDLIVENTETGFSNNELLHNYITQFYKSWLNSFGDWGWSQKELARRLDLLLHLQKYVLRISDLPKYLIQVNELIEHCDGNTEILCNDLEQFYQAWAYDNSNNNEAGKYNVLSLRLFLHLHWYLLKLKVYSDEITLKLRGGKLTMDMAQLQSQLY